MFENAIFRSCPVLAIYLSESSRFLLPNEWLTCLQCMFAIIRSQIFQICNVIHINGIHMLWRGTFQNRGCLRTQYAVLMLSLFSQLMYLYQSRSYWLLNGCLIDWFVWHACLRQSEARKVFQICNTIYINGTHILEVGDIFRTGDVWERNMPFWGCSRSHDVPLWIV